MNNTTTSTTPTLMAIDQPGCRINSDTPQAGVWAAVWALGLWPQQPPAEAVLVSVRFSWLCAVIGCSFRLG